MLFFLYNFDRGPASGKCGKVVLLFEDNPLSKIGVRFDKSVPEGVDLGNSCEEGHGFFCHGIVSLLSFSSAQNHRAILSALTLFLSLFVWSSC